MLSWSLSPAAGKTDMPLTDVHELSLESSQQKKTVPSRKRKSRNEKPASTSNRKTGKSNSGTSSSAKTSTGNKNSGPQTSAEAKRRQEEAQKEVRIAESQLRENEAKVSRGLAELGKLGEEMNQTKANIKQLNLQLSRLDGEIKSLEEGINKNEVELTHLRNEYLKAVKKMRVTKKNRSTLAFIFSSKSMSQAMRRMRYLKEFSAWKSRQTDEINAKISALEGQREILAKTREEQSVALGLQKKSEEKLATQHSRQAALVEELKQNGKALDSHLKRKQAEAAELGNMVSRLIAEEQRKAAEEERKQREEENRRLEEERRQQEELAAKEAAERESELLANSNTKKSKKEKDKKKEDKKEEKKKDKKSEPKAGSSTGKTPTVYADARKREPRGNKSTGTSNEATGNQKSTGSFQDMRGRLPYPSSGSFQITSRFGRQSMPDLPGVEYDNPGIDAETEAGASARAVFKGKVSGVYLLPGYNTVVIVNHGNYYTVYGNISSPSVKTGDNVDAGATLGKLAQSDDDSSHSSIHFEVWKNREKLNPQEWLRN